MDPNQAIVCPYQQEGFRGFADRALGPGLRRVQTSLARWGGFSAIDLAAMADAHHKNQQLAALPFVDHALQIQLAEPLRGLWRVETEGTSTGEELRWRPAPQPTRC